MSEKIKIITDSTTSLTKEEYDKLGIVCLEATYALDSEVHNAFDDDGVSLPEFYINLEKAKTCSTGCINTDTFEKCFDELVSQGYQCVYVGLSGSLSSTFSNSQIAAKTINEKYNKTVAVVIDSKCASYGSLILIERIQELIAENKTIEEIETIVTEDVSRMSVAFVSPDLSFLLKTGRLNALELGIGKLFKIVPIIYVSESGKLKAKDKCIGSKLALKKFKNNFVAFINKNKSKKCYLTSCAMQSDVDEIKKYLIENTHLKDKDIKTGLIDKTLACHCGPRTIAAFCL